MHLHETSAYNIPQEVCVCVCVIECDMLQLCHSECNCDRWKRWHRPVHTLAYAIDPSFHSHTLSRTEKADVKAALKVLLPDTWEDCKTEIDEFRGNPEMFSEKMWNKSDAMHAWKWWRSFGDDFEHLQPLAIMVLSKPASASACEFNWRDCSLVLNKTNSQLKDAKVHHLINIRAMGKLKKAVAGKMESVALPTLDMYLDELVLEQQSEAEQQGLEGAGDDDGSSATGQDSEVLDEIEFEWDDSHEALCELPDNALAGVRL